MNRKQPNPPPTNQTRPTPPPAPPAPPGVSRPCTYNCSTLVKEAERVLKYLREIGEQTRGESTFPSADYANAMADALEYALKQNINISGGASAEYVGQFNNTKDNGHENK